MRRNRSSQSQRRGHLRRRGWRRRPIADQATVPGTQTRPLGRRGHCDELDRAAASRGSDPSLDRKLLVAVVAAALTAIVTLILVRVATLPAVDPGQTGLGVAAAPPGSEAVVVADVVDGDTLTLADGRTVRVLGVDTPETRHPDMERPQPFATDARRRTAELVRPPARVAISVDGPDADHYGRLLRHVWVDGRLLSEVLIEEGLGRSTPYPEQRFFRERLESAEVVARDRGIGLWSLGPTPLPLFEAP